MTGAEATVALAAAVAGGVGAAAVARRRVARPPAWSIRVNVRGARVPAVLGDATFVGALLGLLVAGAAVVGGVLEASHARVAGASGIVVVVLWTAGHLDDRRGDERERGFRGHLRALRGGRVTGGMVKILAGGAAGLAAAALVTSGWRVLAIGALVALSANLLNLLDRAPGRAVKTGLVLAFPTVALGAAPWGVAAGGLLGAMSVALPVDLRERAMLGDAGANPWGGMLGLGLGLSLPDAGLMSALLVVLGANAASERWSFSHIIERTQPLRAFDRWGRRP